jgi:hypothetical protein
MSTQDRGDERYGRLLEQLTARWTSDGQGNYLTYRYQERLLHAHRTASFARKQYRFGRWAIVGFASTAPTFVALATDSRGQATSVLKYIAIGMTLLVAIATAALTAFRSDANWRIYHKLRSDLESVGWKAAAEHSSNGFDEFVKEIEELLATFENEYLKEVAIEQRASM